MRVLITGGSGFVGLNIAEQLGARGDEALLFGLHAPPDPALSVLRPMGVHMAPGDVTRAEDLDRALAGRQVDAIVHGAAITAALETERRAARTIFEVNVLGTVEVLEAALRHRVPRVIQLGTGSIFGMAGLLSEVLDEQESPALPETLYGISKFAAERTGIRYRSTRGLDLSVARLGTIFGRWEYDTGVRDTLSLPLQLQIVAETGGTAVVHAGAADDWVYSVDVARGVLALLDADELSEPIYHLSAGRRWSPGEWCERLRARYPRFSYRIAEDLDACTVGRSKAAARAPMSIERLCRDTTYRPRYLIDEAFEDYLAWRGRHPEFPGS